MALKFITTDQAATDHGVKILVYSKAGIGKTMLCATAPTPFIFSAEAGLLSLRKHKIPGLLIENMDDLMEGYQWVTESDEAKQFETICLDSLSEIAEVVLSNAKATAKDPRQAYGELIEKMSTTIRSFRDLKGKHVYFSAKQELMKDDVTGITTYGPSMPGAKLGQNLSYFFDEVFNLSIGMTEDKKPYRYLLTQPTIQYEAKDRSGALDPVEEPDITKIIEKILGDKNAEPTMQETPKESGS